MEEICKNCQYFESGGVMFVINIWGLCIRFEGENTDDRRKTSFVRWGDYTCPDFKPKEDDLQGQKDKA
jgi:hypothetical protein